MKFTCTVFPIALIGLLFAGCSPVVETDTVKKSDNQQWHFELQKAPPPFEGAVGHDAGIKFISNGCDVVVLPFCIPYRIGFMKVLDESGDGKFRRFTMDFATEAAREEIEAAVLAEEMTQKYLDGKSIKKIIVVPKKIVNIVFG